MLARDTHFVDRSYRRLIADARSILPGGQEIALECLADWLPSGALDQKREDAIGLLASLARRPERPGRRPDTWSFRLTEAWAYDLDAARLWGDDIQSILAEQSR